MFPCRSASARNDLVRGDGFACTCPTHALSFAIGGKPHPLRAATGALAGGPNLGPYVSGSIDNDSFALSTVCPYPRKLRIDSHKH